MMKIYLFAASLIFALSAQALSINGYVIVSGSEHLLIDRETSRTFKIRPSNPDVQKSLSQLATFDCLRGQVSTISSDTLILEVIDFVSLRRLIGDWQADSTTNVRFVNYSRVTFDMDGNAREFTYALSPGQYNGWRIYLTDQSSVVLGTVNVDGANAVLEFYDPRTGQTAQHLQLSKVPPR